MAMARWERELEAVMVKFVDGQIDVLVSTGHRGVRARHPGVQYHHHQSRRPLRPRPALSAWAGVGRSASRPTPTSLIPADGRSGTRRRNGACAVIEEMTELARASDSPCATSRSVDRATSSARGSSTGTSRGRLRSLLEAPGRGGQRAQGEPVADSRRDPRSRPTSRPSCRGVRARGGTSPRSSRSPRSSDDEVEPMRRAR